ncbi:MAG TPA: DUF5318 family protein [Actinomycetota bacterium]|jgi:hypothetical protein
MARKKGERATPPLRAISGGKEPRPAGTGFKFAFTQEEILGRTNGGRLGNGRSTAKKSLGVIDYTLAKRALLRNFRRGLLSKPEICDAHPELMRAARYLGEEATRPCPVCRDWDLRLLAYVFGDSLKQDNGRAFDIQEGLSRTVSNRGSTCYVIEVCTGCSWNHVCEAFLARTAG